MPLFPLPFAPAKIWNKFLDQIFNISDQNLYSPMKLSNDYENKNFSLNSEGTKYYQPVYNYAKKKTIFPSIILFNKSFAGGIWVAVYGHACTSISGLFLMPNSPWSLGIAKLVYACLFSGAFVAIVYTETELFTGNLAVMTFYALHNMKRSNFMKHFIDVMRVLLVSFLGNASGAMGGAYLFSYLSGAFTGEPVNSFVKLMGVSKTNKSFIEIFSLAIGCNMLVCLATLCCTVIPEASGKILAIFFSITIFAAGGYEHIIANLYTLSTAAMLIPEVTFTACLLYNWFPTLFGNLVAGVVFSGISWYYCSFTPELADTPSQTMDNSKFLTLIN